MIPNWVPYWYRVMWEDYKAGKRGEVRVADGMRGRVYEHKEKVAPGVLTGGAAHHIKAGTKVTLTARKWDSAKQEWVDLGVLKEGPIEEFTNG